MYLLKFRELVLQNRCSGDLFRVWFQQPHMPLLNTTFPFSPPLSQNSFSRLEASTLCLCGNAARAKGSANRLVVRIRPRLTGRVSLGFFFSHSCFCNRTKIRGGMTMIGELFNTLLRAVSETARVAAFLLLPKDGTEDSDLPSSASLALSDSERTWYTSIPCLISSPRIKKTFSAPALATAAKGTNLDRTIFVAGLTLFNRGTRALSPNATEHEAPTARKYDCVIFETDRGVDLLAFALLIATLRDWLVICQRSVPVVCNSISLEFSKVKQETHPEAWRQHTSRHNQIRKNKA